jgi:multidrug resistance efflux pump
VEGDQAVIGAKVGGRVVELPVNEGQALKQGDLIAQLSSDQVKARLEQAEHELHTAREEVDQAIARIAVLTRELEAKKTAVHLAEQETQARIARAEAALAEARAHLPHVEATLQRARTDFERYRQLSDKGLIAAQQMDDARAEYQTAKAAEEVARRQIAQAEESLDRQHCR